MSMIFFGQGDQTTSDGSGLPSTVDQNSWTLLAVGSSDRRNIFLADTAEGELPELK